MTPQASGLPPGPGRSAPKPTPKTPKVRLTFRQRLRRFTIRAAIVGGAVFAVVALAVYFSLAGLIDDRLYGERERSLPRVYARPIEIRRGQTFTQQDLIARLNDIGYAQRPDVAQPGEFAVRPNEITITPRTGGLQGQARAGAVPASCRGKPPPRRWPRSAASRTSRWKPKAGPTASSSIARCSPRS